jgi:hypothetical protein
MLKKVDDPDSSSVPAEKFIELSPEVKTFLTGLRSEEISVLVYLIRLAAALMTVGKATRFLVVLIVGFIVGLVMLGESIQKIANWLAAYVQAGVVK